MDFEQANLSRNFDWIDVLHTLGVIARAVWCPLIWIPSTQMSHWFSEKVWDHRLCDSRCAESWSVKVSRSRASNGSVQIESLRIFQGDLLDKTCWIKMSTTICAACVRSWFSNRFRCGNKCSRLRMFSGGVIGTSFPPKPSQVRKQAQVQLPIHGTFCHDRYLACKLSNDCSGSHSILAEIDSIKWVRDERVD